MQRTAADIITQNNSLEKEVALVLSVLESGNSVELPAIGFSMFPTFRPGQRFVVRPLKEGEIPNVGSIVVCLARRSSGKMVMHRLIEIRETNTGKILFFTRGDSRPATDEPYNIEAIIGAVSGRRTTNGVKKVREFLPGKIRRRIYRMLLWVWSMKIRLKSKSSEMNLY
jgi:signal peptidase I